MGAFGGTPERGLVAGEAARNTFGVATGLLVGEIFRQPGEAGVPLALEGPACGV